MRADAGRSTQVSTPSNSRSLFRARFFCISLNTDPAPCRSTRRTATARERAPVHDDVGVSADRRREVSVGRSSKAVMEEIRRRRHVSGSKVHSLVQGVLGRESARRLHAASGGKPETWRALRGFGGACWPWGCLRAGCHASASQHQTRGPSVPLSEPSIAKHERGSTMTLAGPSMGECGSGRKPGTCMRSREAASD